MHIDFTTMLLDNNTRLLFTGREQPIGERGGYTVAGRILRRSDGGRWPNCTVLPTPWPGIYGVAIDTKW